MAAEVGIVGLFSKRCNIMKQHLHDRKNLKIKFIIQYITKKVKRIFSQNALKYWSKIVKINEKQKYA